jgi:hypothetical protein
MVLKKMKYPPSKTTSSLTVLSLLVLWRFQNNWDCSFSDTDFFLVLENSQKNQNYLEVLCYWKVKILKTKTRGSIIIFLESPNQSNKIYELHNTSIYLPSSHLLSFLVTNRAYQLTK